MITLMTRQKIRPHRVADYIALQKDLWQKTQAEPNMVRYEHFRTSEENVFTSILSFRSYADFLDHQVVDYHHNVDWGDMFEEISLQWVDPLEGANDLEHTEIKLPQTITELMQPYVDMLPPEQPQWWSRDGE